MPFHTLLHQHCDYCTVITNFKTATESNLKQRCDLVHFAAIYFMLVLYVCTLCLSFFTAVKHFELQFLYERCYTNKVVLLSLLYIPYK